MQPTSTTQFATAAGEGVPELEQVRDGLFCYGLPQPGTLPHYALSYLLLDFTGSVHVIDAGWDSDENWHRCTEALGLLGHTVTDIASITVTHLHPDHLGMAARLRAASGAPVAIHEAEQLGIRELGTPAPESEVRAHIESWGVPADRQAEIQEAFRRRSGWKQFTADRLLVDGENLDIPGHAVRVLHTPGHTSGHIALVDDLHGVVYLGDHLLPNQFPGIGLGGTPEGNPIDHYLSSLAAVAEFDAFEALPGHGYRFRGIAKRCAETAAHHEKRTAEIAGALSARSTTGPPAGSPAALSTSSPVRSVWALASELTWTAGWENLGGLALRSALSQTSLHMDRAQRL
jgi:glyoxylase-like metal-dependent hydrolase (beta-lactamase superfamily II)